MWPPVLPATGLTSRQSQQCFPGPTTGLGRGSGQTDPAPSPRVPWGGGWGDKISTTPGTQDSGKRRRSSRGLRVAVTGAETLDGTERPAAGQQARHLEAAHRAPGSSPSTLPQPPEGLDVATWQGPSPSLIPKITRPNLPPGWPVTRLPRGPPAGFPQGQVALLGGAVPVRSCPCPSSLPSPTPRDACWPGAFKNKTKSRPSLPRRNVRSGKKAD